MAEVFRVQEHRTYRVGASPEGAVLSRRSKADFRLKAVSDLKAISFKF